MLSAAVRKNVYLDRFYYNLYANVFVILVSKRSGLRKGVPVSLASKILHEAGVTRLVEGMNSIQGVIKELSTQKTLESGKVISNAQAIMLTGEFDTFLVQDPMALTILTALWNTHEHHKGWTKNLRNSAPETLKEPCITLLAASNEVLFDDLVKSKDVEGGFIARSFIVYESKRRSINPLTERPEGILPTKELAEHLVAVSLVTGEFHWTKGSKSVYEKWYTRLCGIEYDDKTGTLDRLGDQVLKLAMILSLAESLDLVISDRHMEIAIEKSEDCVAGVKQVTMGSGTGQDSAATGKILKYLLVTPGHAVSRQVLLKKFWPDVDVYVLDRVIETLSQAGAIESYKSPGKAGLVYKMPEKIVQDYMNFRKEE